jgi:hypothetical protein
MHGHGMSNSYMPKEIALGIAIAAAWPGSLSNVAIHNANASSTTEIVNAAIAALRLGIRLSDFLLHCCIHD